MNHLHASMNSMVGFLGDFTTQSHTVTALLQQSLAPPREPTPPPQEPEANPADETYRTAQEEELTPQPPPKTVPKTKPKVVSVQLRKKREAFVDSVIESLPLEYRGSQPVSWVIV